jgi:hypothetical protein
LSRHPENRTARGRSRNPGQEPPAILFERLQRRYLRRFGAPPPFATSSVKEAVRLLRAALAAAGALEGGSAAARRAP